MALIPNAARQMLESFLSFRCPDKVGSFHGSMQAILEGHDDLDPSVRTHVERYLHSYSHLEDPDISHFYDPAEATVVLRAIFKLMDHVDHEHFTAMCSALRIDAGELLGLPNEVAAQSSGQEDDDE